VLPAAFLALALATPQAEVSPAAAQEAKELAHRSQLEYDVGSAEDALRDVKRAYLLDPLPGLLFNLGQCQRKLKHWEDAEIAFRNYLRYRPDAQNRETVLALIDEMQRERLKAAPPPLPVPARTVAASPPASPAKLPAQAAPTPAPVAHAPAPAAPALSAAGGLGPAAPAPAKTDLLADAWGEEAPKPSKPHALAWIFVATGIAAAVVATIGAVDVAQYQSTSSNIAAAEGTTGKLAPPNFPTYSNLVSQESQAMTWRAIGFVALGVACASIPAVILAW
jgi:tetratricopeptide (TPR) repeat protein